MATVPSGKSGKTLYPTPGVSPGQLARSAYDAIVVGAGHNGLTAAAYLARSGLRVVVLESRSRLGGACTLEAPWPGTTVSPCAYLCGLLHPLVIAELELERRGLNWTQASEGLFVPFPDGESIQLYDDEQRCLEEIRRVAPEDVEGFRAYSADLAKTRDLLRPDDERDIWLHPAPTTDMLRGRLAGFPLGEKIVLDWSMVELTEHYFAGERLRTAYLGQGVIGTRASPFDPGTAFVRFHHGSGRMLGQPGAWGYVRGGMGMISALLAEAALEAGAMLAHDCPAVRIHPGEGVELETGDFLRAPRILCTFSPDQALNITAGVIPAEFSALVRAIPRIGCTLKATLLLDALPNFRARPGAGPQHRGQLNTPLTAEQWKEAYTALLAGELPERLWTELYIQTTHEPKLAPPGQHVMSVFAQYVPYEFAEGDWNSRRDDVRALLMKSLGAYCDNIEAAVVDLTLLGPPDIERETGLPGGHIFQGDILPQYMWERRPNARTPLQGLYLGGAGTNPGGSVMAVNGRNAARSIVQDMGLPWVWGS